MQKHMSRMNQHSLPNRYSFEGSKFINAALVWICEHWLINAYSLADCLLNPIVYDSPVSALIICHAPCNSFAMC